MFCEEEILIVQPDEIPPYVFLHLAGLHKNPGHLRCALFEIWARTDGHRLPSGDVQEIDEMGDELVTEVHPMEHSRLECFFDTV
jgi:hypothetical protein